MRLDIRLVSTLVSPLTSTLEISLELTLPSVLEIYVERVGVKKTYRLISEKSRVGHGRSRGGQESERSVQKAIRISSEV